MSQASAIAPVVACDGKGCCEEFLGNLDEGFKAALVRSGYETVGDDEHLCEDCFARRERELEQEAIDGQK